MSFTRRAICCCKDLLHVSSDLAGVSPGMMITYVTKVVEGVEQLIGLLLEDLCDADVMLGVLLTLTRVGGREWNQSRVLYRSMPAVCLLTSSLYSTVTGRDCVDH